jgi:RimJ/RimL family protein N-acetyltransferase
VPRGKIELAQQQVVITELKEVDLPFLLGLWQIPEVMRYADELPSLRGWSKSDDARTAWTKYQEQRAALGRGYAQMILRSAEGAPIGESFFVPLPEGFSLDQWTKPEGIVCLMGDLKLRPQRWNRGLGTEGMKLMVRWLFGNTNCALLAVPPHGDNPAAIRVYEKAGFLHTEETRSWQGHRIMELWRQQAKGDRSTHAK